MDQMGWLVIKGGNKVLNIAAKDNAKCKCKQRWHVLSKPCGTYTTKQQSRYATTPDSNRLWPTVRQTLCRDNIYYLCLMDHWYPWPPLSGAQHSTICVIIMINNYSKVKTSLAKAGSDGLASNRRQVKKRLGELLKEYTPRVLWECICLCLCSNTHFTPCGMHII